jgi:molybdopterin/thiamine biosynthesis adenylyltransferase
VNHAAQAITHRWREDLVGLGFCDDGERLRGPVWWSAPNGGPVQARVEICPGAGFPFSPPRVVILDPGVPLEATFHAECDGALCLWSVEWAVDRAPWRDPQVLLDRIVGWLTSTAAGWPGDDSCDLERYLPQDRDTFVLYDANDLVLDAAVRTRQGPAPGTVVVTGERRTIRDSGGGRRRRRDRRLAWIGDIGAVIRPLRDWDDVAIVLGGRAAEVTRLIRFGFVTLLLLRYAHGGVPGALAVTVRSTPAGIELAACESADTSAATRGLRAGRTATDLAGVRVAVIGCGAIGSFAADLLFRAGVRHLTLADGGRLRPGNLVRHRAGAEQVGRRKTDAVRVCLATVDPDVSQVRTRGPLVDLDDAAALVKSHQVVLDATGSGRASSLLAVAADRVGRGTGHTVVSVCAQREGQVVRVDRMPLRRGEVHLPDLPVREHTEQLREGGCGSPVSATPPGAVTAAAELAHRVVLDEATRACLLPASMVEVRTPQPEPLYQEPGLATSLPAVSVVPAAAS